MIRIGLISHSPNLNGAERMLLNLAIVLGEVETIYPILFIPNMNQGSLVQEAEKNNIRCINLPGHQWYIYQSIADANSFHEYCESLPEAAAEFKTILENSDLDLIINNTMTSIVPALCAIALQKPLISWVHGILDSYLVPLEDTRYRLLMDRTILDLSTSVICCSDMVRRYYGRYTEAEKITTIYNWTYAPTVSTKFQTKNNTFVCLNTFDPNKGLDILVKASKILKDRKYHFNVVLYGAGPEENNIIKQIKREELEDIIQLKGKTTNVTEAYVHSLALIQPSYYESFGMTVIEAMAHGRPVICAKSGGTEETVRDGINGFLVDAGEPVQLADKMAFLLENKKNAEQMGLAGLQHYKDNFSSTKGKTLFLKQIDKAIKSFKNYNRNDLLLYDLLDLLHQKNAASILIQKEAESIIAAETDNKAYEAPPRAQAVAETEAEAVPATIDFSNLIPSAKIKNKKQYLIHIDRDSIRGLNIISDIRLSQSGGIMKMVLKSPNFKEYPLRVSEVNLGNMEGDTKISFKFERLYNTKGKCFIVEFILECEAETAGICIYEWKNKYPKYISKIIPPKNNLYCTFD